MSSTTDTPVDVMPKRRLFTALEYHQMAEAGILDEDSRVELLDGEILEMPPISGGHMDPVNEMNERLVVRLVGRAIVSVQNPVRLNDMSEPQPDFAVLRPEMRGRKRVPEAADVLLLVEIAYSTLQYDRDIKTKRYAAAGIPQVWLFDVRGRRATDYRDPHEGAYRSVTVHEHGDSITMSAFSDVRIAVADILG